ncbi:hypothetical protein HPB52_021078 [Rhipicephalus sanguineus]|uniref:Uncharacterized protein n=1 Tax=Rhipicephalus sanguineus TaxID=34632 RepID=A0A9D4T4W6_RHISA|nr:hypothetical protein HPB52_021078 [Rhipicephalus sanguineus]
MTVFSVTDDEALEVNIKRLYDNLKLMGINLSEKKTRLSIGVDNCGSLWKIDKAPGKSPGINGMARALSDGSLNPWNCTTCHLPEIPLKEQWPGAPEEQDYSLKVMNPDSPFPAAPHEVTTYSVELGQLVVRTIQPWHINWNINIEVVNDVELTEDQNSDRLKKLCKKHFHPSDFVTSTSYTDTVTGKVIEVPLKLRRLKPGTVPSIFPGCPTYLSQDKSAAREGPEEKRARMEAKALQDALQESLITQQEEEQSNAISSLEDLLCHTDKLLVGDFWSKVIVKDSVWFLNFVPQDAPVVLNQEPDEDLVIEGWESLKTEASAEDFVTADNNVATCGLRFIEDLVDEVDEVESDSDGEGVDVCDQLPSTSETLHGLDILRHTISAGSVSNETATRFYSFQAGLLGDIEDRKVQTNITDFFGRK